jgi:uncharacterized protein YkwD
VLTPSRLLAITLFILSCATFALAGPATAATPPRATMAARRHSDRDKHVRIRCATKSAAHVSRRARLAARRLCDTGTLEPRIRNAATRRHTHSHGTAQPAETSPTPEPTAPAAEATPVQNVAATIASVLATPCQDTELTPSPENIQLVRAAILCLINRKRAENSESPLQPSAQLEQAAEGHCAELVADDYFAHVSPSGETPVDRIRGTGYIPSQSDGYVIGENLAWGTYQLSTPQSIVSAWFASPGHLANILEAQYRETGIGVTPSVPASLAEGAPGATYAQEFGVIIR